MKRSNHFVDRTGKRYGRLVALSYRIIIAGKNNSKVTIWLCKCDCGNYKEVRSGVLNSGNARSCGCLQKESRFNRNHKTHGMSDTGTWQSWSSMRERCSNPNVHNYKDYGGRGIKVCDEWMQSFESFYRDMGDRPKGMSLDRINNDGNYEPGNCRWATIKQQIANRRTPIKKHMKEYGMRMEDIARRLHKTYKTVLNLHRENKLHDLLEEMAI